MSINSHTLLLRVVLSASSLIDGLFMQQRLGLNGLVLHEVFRTIQGLLSSDCLFVRDAVLLLFILFGLRSALRLVLIVFHSFSALDSRIVIDLLVLTFFLSVVGSSASTSC